MQRRTKRILAAAAIVLAGVLLLSSLPFLAGWWRWERLNLPAGTDLDAKAGIQGKNGPVLIGDPLTYEIVVYAGPGVKIGQPVAPKAQPGGTDVELKPAGNGHVQRILGGVREVFDYEVRFFDTGDITLTGAALPYTDAQGSKQQLSLDDIKVTVRSLLPADDSQVKMKDVKQPIGLPFDWLLLSGIILCILAAAALVWLFIRYLRHRPRRSREAVRETVVTVEPAHVVAYRCLDELRASCWFAEGAAEPFFMRLSLCIRVYFQERYGIKAPELTTEEFLAEIGSVRDIPEEARPVLRELSALWDRVKFALHVPPRNVMADALDSAHRLIDLTLPPEPAAGEPEREAAS